MPNQLERVTRPLRILFKLMGRRAQRSTPVGPGAARPHLERIAAAFFIGYAAALDAYDEAALDDLLHRVEPPFRGFAFEGAAMALTMLDLTMPVRATRLTAFAAGPGAPHVYMAYVGAGWAVARLRRPPERLLASLDPLLGWLAIDGYGFHEGYFHSRTYVGAHGRRPRISGHGARVFDQGLGRSLWFVDAADVDRIAGTIATFEPARRSDLWSGVALAAVYAGGVDVDRLRRLAAHASGYESALAQGAAFAAEARERARNMVPHTELACRLFAGVAAGEAARVVRDLSRDARDRDEAPAYQCWRERIGAALAPSRADVSWSVEDAHGTVRHR